MARNRDTEDREEMRLDCDRQLFVLKSANKTWKKVGYIRLAHWPEYRYRLQDCKMIAR